MEQHLFPRQQQQGSNRDSGSNSVSALLTTLVPVFAVALVIFLAFIFLQRRFDRVYGPRTYLSTLSKNERTPKQSPGFMGWVKEYRSLKDEYILDHNSIDNYLWLRFLKLLSGMCLVGCIITWPVLFPVSATGNGGQQGLAILSWSNIENANRYYAYIGCAWLFLGFVMYMITRETYYYVNLRQAYLLSPYMTSKLSSKTVLFKDVPEYYQNEANIRHIMPGVRNVWMTYDTSDLDDLVEERTTAADKLETGEIAMIGNYVKKQAKEGNEGHSDRRGRIEVDEKDRPTHKTKFLIGKKVDTVNWARGELHRLIPEVAKKQHETRSGKGGKLQSAVFVEFESMRHAQAAFQQVAHQKPYHMTPVDTGMIPSQVNWDNLKLPWWRVKLQSAFGTALVCFLCLFWTIPVAAIGAISNIDSLIQTPGLTWLSFINSIPSEIRGVVTGLLPVVLLAILMALVPIILGLIANTFEPTAARVQLKIQQWYFPFCVIQVFLITTFSSGAAAVAQDIVNDPTSAPTLLANNLPKASNFYISYFILQGLMVAALQFLNIVPLLFVLVLGKILDKTPRKMYNRYVTLGGIGWGPFYAKFANFGVIALSYSCISPLVLGFACVGFFLMYLGFRYNMFFTLGVNVDLKGQAYVRALQQLTVGVYLTEFCLIGLCAIKTGSQAAATGPLILMIIFTAGTILYHMQMKKALAAHMQTLPSDLLADEYRNLHGDEYDNTEKGQAGNNSVAKHNSNNGHGIGRHASSSEDSETTKYQVPRNADPPERPTGLVGKIKSFLFPGKYSSAAILSRRVLSPHLSTPVRPYTAKERADAYAHPSIADEMQIIWIARDSYGLSQQEITDSRREVGEGLEMTDEGAWVNEKGKVEWDERNVAEAPIHEDPPIY
ncbi:hypothetical protein MBLNU230_g7692t1 [Neophaeotheca triangularis]